MSRAALRITSSEKEEKKKEKKRGIVFNKYTHEIMEKNFCFLVILKGQLSNYFFSILKLPILSEKHRGLRFQQKRTMSERHTAEKTDRKQKTFTGVKEHNFFFFFNSYLALVCLFVCCSCIKTTAHTCYFGFLGFWHCGKKKKKKLFERNEELDNKKGDEALCYFGECDIFFWRATGWFVVEFEFACLILGRISMGDEMKKRCARK
jgi:hypothetical protein